MEMREGGRENERKDEEDKEEGRREKRGNGEQEKYYRDGKRRVERYVACTIFVMMISSMS